MGERPSVADLGRKSADPTLTYSSTLRLGQQIFIQPRLTAERSFANDLKQINPQACHSSEGWDPWIEQELWIPAFAGMTHSYIQNFKKLRRENL